jgi:hypothetical protein
MRVVLTLLLLVAATPVWAEWVKFFPTNADAIYIWYFDPASVHKDGNLRQVWTMEDLPQSDRFGALSYRQLLQLDCEQKRRRLLKYYFLEGHMGTGKVLVEIPVQVTWKYIAPPDALHETLLKIACAQ